MTLDGNAVDRLFDPWNRADSPGCAVAVIHHGHVAHRNGYGMANLEYGIPVTPGSVFHVASVSKQFTAFSVALLANERRLSLDGDIREYIPELPDLGQMITPRQLIHHTSGLPDQWDLLTYGGWREDDVKTNGDILGLITRQHQLNFPPGTQYLYSNTGYTLLAILVERITGASLRAFTTERLFAPLDMNQTHFRDDHAEVVANRTYAYMPAADGNYRISVPVYDSVGATSLVTTVDDLALWVDALAHAALGGQELVEEVLEPGTLQNGEKLEYAFGLLVRRYRGQKVIEHSGVDAGYRAYFLWFPERELATIVLCNLSTIEPRGLAYKVADLYLRSSDSAAGAALSGSDSPGNGITPSESGLQRLVGLYRDPATRTYRKVIMQEGRLKLANLLGTELLSQSDRRFAGRLATIDIEFATDGDGVEVLREHTPGNRRTFKKLATQVPLPVEHQIEYEGEYASTDLLSTITIRRSCDGLSARRPKFADKLLVPVDQDAFAVDDCVDFSFVRDDAGRVTQLMVATERSRFLCFCKLS